MTRLYRLASKNNDPRRGGVLIIFPSDTTKTVEWTTEAPIEPTMDAAKKYAAKVMSELMKRGGWDDINRTNWVSITAAIQKHIVDFNVALRAYLHAAPMLIGSQQIFDASTAIDADRLERATDPVAEARLDRQLGGPSIH